MASKKNQLVLPIFTGSLALDELVALAEDTDSELTATDDEETEALELTTAIDELDGGAVDEEDAADELDATVPVRTRIPLSVPLSVLPETSMVKLPSFTCVAKGPACQATS